MPRMSTKILESAVIWMERGGHCSVLGDDALSAILLCPVGWPPLSKGKMNLRDAFYEVSAGFGDIREAKYRLKQEIGIPVDEPMGLWLRSHTKEEQIAALRRTAANKKYVKYVRARRLPLIT